MVPRPLILILTFFSCSKNESHLLSWQLSKPFLGLDLLILISKTTIMKTKNLLLLLLVPLQMFSQQTSEKFEIRDQKINFDSKIIPHESVFTAVHFEKSECLSEGQRLQLKFENEKNRQLILNQNPEAFTSLEKMALFQDPFRPKAGFSDYGYHTLNYQVDHNLTPNNNLLDYNCGARTYDWETGNHEGSDYILWPYPWKRMQENTMEITAAASGIILNKKNGFNDLNCANNGNPNWNGIVVQHADGSIAIYMHFKKNSATTKEIGDAVAAGEFLGIAGSSGSSTTPHLHFEVHDQNGQLIDPYKGNCNTINTTSWWASQEDYYVPKINRLSMHYSIANDAACPVVENTYEKTNFKNGDLLVLKAYYRDIKPGDVTHVKITNPNGAVVSDYSWEQNWGVIYATAYAYWSFNNITSDWLTGVYNVEVTFGGHTYNTMFGVRTNLSTEDQFKESFSVYPNPVTDILHLKNFLHPESAEIVDMSGRSIKKIRDEIKGNSINVINLPKGTYILKIKSKNEQITTVKFIKL